MRCNADHFGDEELVLLFIGSRLKDAKRLEERLTAIGVDYLVEVDHYRGGFLFPALRAGAFFYCRDADAVRARDGMITAGFRPYSTEDPT